MKEYYQNFSNLNKWANNIVRETMKDYTIEELALETPYGSLQKLTLHITTAINHWLDFFDTTYNIIWKENEIDYTNWSEILQLWEKTDERLGKVLASFESDEAFEEYFTYSHNKKDTYKMKYNEMFLHLVCHSYYHRGQLVMFFRQKGLKVSPPLDADDFFKIKIPG